MPLISRPCYVGLSVTQWDGYSTGYASSGFVSVDLLPQLIKGAEPVIRDGIKSYHADWKQLNSHLEAALERYFYQEMGIAPKATVIIHEGS